MELRVKDLPSLLAELSLQTEESLFEFVKDGLSSAAESVKDALQVCCVVCVCVCVCVYECV